VARGTAEEGTTAEDGTAVESSAMEVVVEYDTMVEGAAVESVANEGSTKVACSRISSAGKLDHYCPFAGVDSESCYVELSHNPSLCRRA